MDRNAEVLKQKAAFLNSMAELHKWVLKPALLYPAKPRITLPTGERKLAELCN